MKLGWNEDLNGWVIPWPVNLHVHFRFDPEIMKTVIPFGANWYRFATCMPNFGKDRIVNLNQVKDYHKRVIEIASRINRKFNCTVPLYLELDTKPETIIECFNNPTCLAAKLYPKDNKSGIGGTTGAEFGVDFLDLEKLDPVFETMSRIGMRLLIHAELQRNKNGHEVDIFDREWQALPYVYEVLKRHPNLWVVLEHISSTAAVTAIEKWQLEGRKIQATIAPQYLIWSRNELFRGGISPDKYSIPALKTEFDQTQLVNFVLRGNGFLGTDSAPHLASHKHQGECCPGGVFNDPAALSIYFDIFCSSGIDDWFEKFVEFACHRGLRFYGVEELVSSEPALLIQNKTEVIPPTIHIKWNEFITPMLSGKSVRAVRQLTETELS